ncbi:MAG: amino acid adenylation domain-containing protein, partial [bacterium]|nr:amino acid adenylation domain-containing protein [bacterium]
MFVKDEEELLLFSSEFINQKEYWCEQLSGDIKRTGILPDGIIENGSRAKRATADMDIPHFISERIAKLSNNSDLSTCIILLTALKILIYRYTNNRDISVLSPVCKLNASEDTINDRILIRDYIEPNITVKELLLKIRATTLEGYENQDYPFDKLMEFLSHQPETETASPISDIAFFSGNIHEDVDIAGLESRLGFGFDMEEEHLEGRIVYDAGVYGETFIRRMAAHYTGLLEHALQDFNADFSEFSFLTDSEKQLLLVDFNDGGTGYRRDKTIAGLFEEQVEKTPGNTAVEYEGKQLTYLELNKMAGTIADLLRARDIGEKKIVGIMTERRPEMIAAMLGILKSGAAYLPIDPGQPGNRIEYILKDSGIQTLLTQDHLKENINFHGEVICIEAIDQWEQAPLPSGNRAADYSENMAYIIYTSGSTGVPKGVVIENGAICNTLLWRKAYYGFDEKDVILQLPSYTFDSSVEDIFTPLISGASIVLVRQQDISDPGYLEHLIKNSGITHFLIVPGFYKSLLGTIHTSLRNLNSVTVAGEGFSEKLVKEHFEILPGVKLFNEYGPTENSVCTTVYEFDKSRTEVLIGKPISNVSCFIVDDNLKLRPIGIPGELCLSGPGLASEYLNNPGLTGEKFVDNPFIPGKKMYRTGDLAKWCEDGNIKFLGRVDHQVKIRGYRIEPGEIEAHLTELDNISEALVLVKEIPGEMETGNKYLCAYLVSDTDISVTQLRRSLATRLPDYMIPAYFVRLEKMPLNANGKINRNALPDPGKSGLTTDSQYAAPVNAVEGKLVEIWQDVLGSSRIGINDNFFEIGGDSIRTIQVASRMSKEGYRLRMKDIFQNPTIAKLAAVLKKTERIALQSAVQGRVKLTPIQSWFFKNKLMENYHYNHSVMLYSADGFDEQAVRAVFSKLQQHHDALRMTFSREPNGEIIQTNGGEDYPFSLQVYDCVDASENTIELKANELQASINLESGPMMKLGVFHSEDGDRLLIVIHHLVIDGISWRILFEDIGTLFQQYEKSEPLELPLKTDSFKLWAEGLSRYACNDSFLKKEAYHPLPSGRGIPVIPTDFDHNDNYVKDIESASFTLPTRETALLLTEVNEAFSTEIDDILLTALGLAIRGVSGTEELLIALEGHGRADILKDVDISRTVGWFTTICPFLLDFSYDEKINGSGNESLARQIKEIKESVRRLPNRGINYGIREYLTEAGSCEESVPAPRISFNYLGQFDSDVEKMPFSIAEESHGNTRSPNGKRGYELDVSGIIKNKKLKMTIDFNRNRYKKETIENLLEHFNRQLKRIISYCTTCGKKESTPSDLTYPHLSIEEFDTLQNQYLIDDIYPCTPLQEGIIFHSLVADASHGEPSVQISYRLQGELDEDAARRSLNMLINRYEVLRTAFIHEGVERHLQMVLKERRASFYYKDLRTAGSPG